MLEKNFPKIFNLKLIKKHNIIICSSVIIHKDIFKFAGMFIKQVYADDYQFWKRVLKFTNCAYVDKPLVYYDDGHGGGKNY